MAQAHVGGRTGMVHRMHGHALDTHKLKVRADDMLDRYARCCEDRSVDLTRPWPHGYIRYVIITKVATRALGQR